MRGEKKLGIFSAHSERKSADFPCEIAPKQRCARQDNAPRCDEREKSFDIEQTRVICQTRSFEFSNGCIARDHAAFVQVSVRKRDRVEIAKDQSQRTIRADGIELKLEFSRMPEIVHIEDRDPRGHRGGYASVSSR